jgi:tRNA-2-methylthio-N6-dimethylallyladenosine synthase
LVFITTHPSLLKELYGLLSAIARDIRFMNNEQQQLKFFIKTFGCQMNVRDSEIVAQTLIGHGYHPAAIAEDADIILINTCSIRDKAEQKVYSLLGQLHPLKKNGERGKKVKIGVLGCVAQQEGEKIIRRAPFVDLIAGTQQIYKLPEMLERLISGQSKRELATDISPSFSIPPFQKLFAGSSPPASPAPKQSPVSAFVTIMQGCNNYCSYCVVPATRGREISRPVADIIEEVRILVDKGVREITLLGQNVNSYGQTNAVAGNKKVSFSDLIRQIAPLPNLERLRFTTSNPKDLSRELIECFAEIDNLCPHFHLPVQSGSNRILARMNRKYTRESYIELVEQLRAARPDVVMATDIIVGFPGETDEDFDMTMDLLETIRFHSSFSFKYSDRPHTRSAEFGEKVPEDVKKERLAWFQSLQKNISLEENRKYISTTQAVFLEDVHENGFKGRTKYNQIVHSQEKTSKRTGDTVMVEIIHAGKHSLNGKLIAEKETASENSPESFLELSEHES